MATLKNPKADLRRKYSLYLKIGLIFALALIILSFKLSPDQVIIKLKKEKPEDPIIVEPPVSTDQKSKIPLKPKEPKIVDASTEDLQDDYILPDIDDYKPEDLPDNPPKPNIDLSDEIFIEIAEKLPQPLGGLKSLQEKIHYTEIARKAGIEGTVYIRAKIDKNGDVVDATVLKGLGGGLDEEALNAVMSTKFHPGEQRGRPVNVKMVIPIKFVLR